MNCRAQPRYTYGNEWCERADLLYAWSLQVSLALRYKSQHPNRVQLGGKAHVGSRFTNIDFCHFRVVSDITGILDGRRILGL